MMRHVFATSIVAAALGCGSSPRPVPVGDAGIGPRDGGGVVDAAAMDGSVPGDGSAGDAGRFDGGLLIDVGTLPPDEPDGGRGDGGGIVCSDVPVPERPCLTTGDCGGMGACALPSPGACLPCIEVTMECDAENPCETGNCVTRNEHCSCPTRTCEPACTAGSCPAGESCGSDGICVPDACTAGYACPRNTACEPAATDADDHGCAPLECSADTDCDCGLCIDGLCVEGFGECVSI